MTLAVLDTTRLLLRQLKETDVSAIYSLRSNEQVNQFLDRPPAKDPEEAKAFIQKILENRSCYWGITLKENDKMIGTICFWNLSADRKSAELGYELHPEYQGKGYMDEAMKEVIGFAFRSGFTSLKAYTHKDNLASTKLLLKHGFVHEEERNDRENLNNMIFSLTKPAG
jgi:[ribosomal protein S5]-alanine N-acetyltransferase